MVMGVDSVFWGNTSVMCVCVCVCVCVVCGGYEYSHPVVSSSGQAVPSSKEVKGELSIQDDDGKMEEEEQEGTRVVVTRQFTVETIL